MPTLQMLSKETSNPTGWWGVNGKARRKEGGREEGGKREEREGKKKGGRRKGGEKIGKKREVNKPV